MTRSLLLPRHIGNAVGPSIGAALMALGVAVALLSARTGARRAVATS